MTLQHSSETPAHALADFNHDGYADLAIVIGVPENESNPARTSMEEERKGAMAIAQLNRILLGI